SLFAVLAGARPRNKGERAVANFCSVTKIDNRALGPQIERDQLVRFGHTNRLRYSGQIFETAEIDRTLITGYANGGAGRAGHHVRAKAERFDDADYTIELRLGGIGVHYNQHKIRSLTSGY